LSPAHGAAIGFPVAAFLFPSNAHLHPLIGDHQFARVRGLHAPLEFGFQQFPRVCFKFRDLLVIPPWIPVANMEAAHASG
jgi:hypothetical protein